MKALSTRHVVNVAAPTSGTYYSADDLHLTQGDWQVIPNGGTLWVRDGVAMGVSAPYTTHGVAVPRDCTDLILSIGNQPFSIYLPAGVAVCLRRVE